MPTDLLRAVLGALCVFFAHLSGRVAARAYRGEQQPRRAFGWALRTLVTGLAVAWRHGLDGVMIATLVGAALSAGAGAWLALRPQREEEDLSKQIFPPE